MKSITSHHVALLMQCVSVIYLLTVATMLLSAQGRAADEPHHYYFVSYSYAKGVGNNIVDVHGLCKKDVYFSVRMFEENLSKTYDYKQVVVTSYQEISKAQYDYEMSVKKEKK